MQEQGKTKEIQKEISAFIREPIKINLSNGKILEIKPLSWKKELQLIKLLGKFVEEGIGTGLIPTESMSFLDTGKLIGNILQKSPDVITEMVMIITDKDRNFVENELVLEDIVEIVSPFLESMLIRLKKVVSEKIMPVIQQVKKDMKQK
ncbi:MAG: hypothetical protein DRP34_00450 [Thermodesulfobacteriota bacterium]|nr:MAG: hypothetical protein DRP34_00450 [Thermodesulfobacteriota bacterium]